MEELIPKETESKLVKVMHLGAPALPKPFERDIFLLGIEVAGARHAPNIVKLYEILKEGDIVRLVREPNNPYDKYAVRLDLQSDTSDTPDADRHALAESPKLGYIPMIRNKVFARLMDAGKMLYGKIRIKEINPGGYYRIVVKIYMKD